MSIPEKRDLSIDIAKGLGIIMIVFAHNMQDYSVRAFFFPFHTHFFFFLAGCNFNLSKYREHPGDFLKGRVLNLMIPYLAACICSYFLYTAVAPIVSLPPITTGALVDGIISGNLVDLDFNIVLWFLPVLFCTNIIFWFLGYMLKGFYLFTGILLVSIAGIILGRTDNHLIFGLDIAMTLQLFIYSGYMLKQSNWLEKTAQTMKSGFWKALLIISVFLPLIAVLIYSAHQPSPGIPNRAYHQPVLFFLAGLSGSVLVMMVSLVIATVLHRYVGRILRAIGRASLDILISHLTINYLVASVCALLWGIWIYDTFTKYWYLLFLLGVTVPALTHALMAFVLNKKIGEKHHFN